MNCGDVDRLLSEGVRVDAVRTQVHPHVDSCPKCAAIVGWAGATVGEPGVEALSRSISTRLKADLSPVRTLSPDPVLALLFTGSGLVVSTTFLAMMGVRGWHAMSSSQVSALGAFAAAISALLIVSLIRAMRPAAPGPLPLSAVLGALVIGYPALAMLLFPFAPAEHFISDGVRCVAGGLMAGALASGLALIVARRGYVLDARRYGLMIGGFGAIVSLLTLQMFCPGQESAHLTVWHGLAILGTVLTGGLSGARLLGVPR